MDIDFTKMKIEGEKYPLPDECEENDRAVRFLALETGVGHFDNLNLLVLAVLFIFISVAFLAVNGGKINTDDEELTFSKETLMTGEFTKNLEERYLRDLPLPEEMKSAREHIALLYGFGNKLSEKTSGNYTSASEENYGDTDTNPFDRDDDKDKLSENAVTTTAVVTDKDGNTVTEDAAAETAPGGGTTAVSRPLSTLSTTTTTGTDEEETTTTNNEAPVVTTTTTVVTQKTETSSETVSTAEPPTDTQTSDTEPPVTEPSDTDTGAPDTQPSEPVSSEAPAE
ncbi:hypothetical protein [Ruminococcus sp.]|uniref:hypothetical protein n=1 Tax=Ruminococcus sp. TaxID=41978 RepID=UPI0025D61E56|nr:hypothetical protein [Ruminococcus sp.]MBQ8967076.1 hypothetical protein [Ruminococcus sp.]